MTAEPSSPFRPGDNAWRIEIASRAAVIVESAHYFRALRESLAHAREQVLIVGWDFDRRERLGRGDDDPSLQDALCRQVEDNADLDAWLLSWNYNPVYAREREWFQDLKLRFGTDERLHVHFDGAHPPGGSQHQKLVVIDDRVAFCGGIDLSRWRWDDASHAPDDPRRTDPDGKPYPPFHDAMMVVEGDAAAALGELARARWQRCGASPCPGQPARNDHATSPWPDSVEPAWEATPVAIARTLPAWEEHEPVREVEQLWLDTIASAQDYIYIENQYFSSARLASALAERLAGEQGPDVVLVLPHHTGGWLEQVTMDELRRHRLEQLYAADHADRLRVRYPHQPGLGDGECISVHAKIAVIDDRLVRIGSANASNRSMGLDSECDLAIDAPDSTAAADTLDRLLSEHLDTSPNVVRDHLREHGRLSRVIDELASEQGRSLRPLEREASGAPLDLNDDGDLLDPEEPIDPNYLVQRAIPKQEQPTGHRRLIGFILLVVLMLALAAAWRWTPLGDALDTQRLQDWLGFLDDGWARFGAVLAVIAITSLFMLPLSLLVVVAAVLLGPWQGFACSMIGALISGAAGFQAGKLMGGTLLERYDGSRVHRLSQRLSERGIMAVAVLRMIPVAPYTVVNVVAGASHISLFRFMVGSAIGLLPGIGALTLFSGSLVKAVKDPGAGTVTALVVVVVVIALAATGLKRVLKSS
ncbi:hypothetical protein F3N42_12770 [Marinihelvus fidelis]|uniref:PLD phosphodiesterase domain-containing protein n=1 Tax=Marinihelvus fidelis TaxID=2613842 RepID=A0A5N0T7S8_9GAMM|nr:VTT domain-containing protein [Marinihelvus fidelis]KAA9130554.1 hypothetical protein F3N42_12770 [Marinihelvus fidelis]